MDKMRVKGAIEKSAPYGDIYTALATKAVIDRDREIIIPSGIVNRSQYLKSNPVIYFDHAWATWDAPSESTLPVGKALTAIVKPEGLVMSWKFTELDFAQQIKYLVDIEVLNTVSIGFIPVEVERDPIKIAETLEKLQIEAKETPYRLYTKWELLELSIVGIPSNREAEIQRSLTAKGFKPPQIEEVKSILHDLDSSGPTPEMSEAGAQGVEPRGRKGLRFGTSANVKTVKLGGRFYEKR